MPRGKRSAWASITKVDDATYRIRYWGKDVKGTYRRLSRTVRGSRKDAEKVRAELMLAHSDDAPCPTVEHVWRTYALPDMERRLESGDLAQRTLTMYRSAWNAHVEPRWGDMPCDAVRPLAVQQWLYELPLNPAQKSLNLMRLLLDYAVRYELVDHNTAREKYIMPSKSTVNTHNASVWTLDELGDIWKQAYGQWWEVAFLLSAFGGLRVGEALGVRTEDVRVASIDGQRLAMIAVERQVTKDGVTDKLKTPRSRRTVAIPGRVGERIVQLAAERDGWLTGDGLGGPTKRNRVLYAWGTMLDDADMERRPLTNLRNSWETNCRWSLRLPPWIVEPMMGHVGDGVTGRHYDRPQAEMFAAAMADAYRQNPYDMDWELPE